MLRNLGKGLLGWIEKTLTDLMLLYYKLKLIHYDFHSLLIDLKREKHLILSLIALSPYYLNNF